MIQPLDDIQVPLPLNPHFNGSMIEYNGLTLMAYRHGDRGQIALTLLSPDWKPARSWTLSLGRLPEDSEGQQDPRLFIYNGKLHISYAGLSTLARKLYVNQCVAVLNNDLWVENCFYLHYPPHTIWEKNWAPFTHDNDLYAVYTIRPHKVIHLGRKGAIKLDVVDLPNQSQVVLPGAFEPRGGTPPVLHNGEYYHFYHGALGTDLDRLYMMGLYTFSASPPFTPLRHIPAPLLYPDMGNKPDPNLINCVFPMGAILRNGVWYISYGAWDRQVRIVSYSAQAIESMLMPLDPTPQNIPDPGNGFDRQEFDKLGPWGTRFYIRGEGVGGLFEANRDLHLQWFRSRFPTPGRVLELGCWEGGHTLALSQTATEVVALEGRAKHLEKAKYIERLFGLGNVFLLHKDIETDGIHGQYDVCFCVGILYHLEKPWAVLKNLANCTKNLFIWTHLCRPTEAGDEPVEGVRGKWVNDDDGEPNGIGGMRAKSFWPTEQGLMTMLNQTGFTQHDLIDCGIDRGGLAHITLVASKP